MASSVVMSVRVSTTTGSDNGYPRSALKGKNARIMLINVHDDELKVATTYVASAKRRSCATLRGHGIVQRLSNTCLDD